MSKRQSAGQTYWCHAFGQWNMPNIWFRFHIFPFPYVRSFEQTIFIYFFYAWFTCECDSIAIHEHRANELWWLFFLHTFLTWSNIKHTSRQTNWKSSCLGYSQRREKKNGLSEMTIRKLLSSFFFPRIFAQQKVIYLCSNMGIVYPLSE